MKNIFLLSIIICASSISMFQSALSDIPHSKYSISSGGNEIGIKGSIKLGAGSNIGASGIKSVFKSMGAKSKYAFGNDNENEIILGIYDRYLLNNDLYIHNQVNFKFASEDERKIDYRKIDEIFSEIGNLDTKLGKIKIWAGKRRYSKFDLEMNDLNLIDILGRGTGVEDIDLSFGKLSYAYIKSKPLIINDRDQTIGKAYQINHDFRLYDIDSNKDGNITLWYNHAKSRCKTNYNYPVKNGYAIGLFHEQKMSQGSNFLSVQYGTNIMYNLKGDYIEEAIDDAILYRNSKIKRVSNSNTTNISDNLAIMSMGLFEETKSNSINQTWKSIGLRPLYYLNDNYRLAFENSYDFVKYDIHRNRLNKMTFALEYLINRHENTKSLLKLYLTKAKWNKSNRIESASNKFNNKNRGTVIGLQLNCSL